MTEFDFEGKRVFVFGNGHRPILLMHELPGLTPQCICLAKALAARDFTVYVPLLFGEFGKSATGRNILTVMFNGEWRPFRKTTAPIAGYLRSLADHIHGKHPDARMGAIGMCLTGGLALALLDRPYVNAAVASQPSLPFARTSHTGLSPEDVETVRRRNVPFLFFRFQTDTTCKHGKLVAFHDAFGTGLVDAEELTPPHPKAHAALTVELFEADCTWKQDPAALGAFQKVVTYLDGRLR